MEFRLCLVRVNGGAESMVRFSLAEQKHRCCRMGQTSPRLCHCLVWQFVLPLEEPFSSLWSCCVSYFLFLCVFVHVCSCSITGPHNKPCFRNFHNVLIHTIIQKYIQKYINVFLAMCHFWKFPLISLSLVLLFWSFPLHAQPSLSPHLPPCLAFMSPSFLSASVFL